MNLVFLDYIIMCVGGLGVRIKVAQGFKFCISLVKFLVMVNDIVGSSPTQRI